MRKAGVAYKNLRVEMARLNIGIVEMAEKCGYNRNTLARKLSKKSPLYLAEAFEIQQKFFPSLGLHYLFANEVRDSV